MDKLELMGDTGCAEPSDSGPGSQKGREGRGPGKQPARVNCQPGAPCQAPRAAVGKRVVSVLEGQSQWSGDKSHQKPEEQDSWGCETGL